jgi:hypothetical protein
MTRTADPALAEIPADWLAEFQAAARRPLEQRMRYAFVRTYKPILDDAPFRAFDTMEQYRQWCEASLPDCSNMAAAFEYRQAQEYLLRRHRLSARPHIRIRHRGRTKRM